jgi:hypothetical protein
VGQGSVTKRGLFQRREWPFAVLYLGFPLWWVVGLADIGFILVAIPMAVYLVRTHRVYVPRGFGLWVLFLIWLAVGVLVLSAHAPGSADGGGQNRIFTFTYRALQYLAITIAMLYIGNVRERDLPTQRLARLLGFMFVVTTVGGMLGVLIPHSSFRSVLEIVLPHGLASQPFVNSLIHPKFAEIESILGYQEARPIAPFPYANTWGANLALYLPFFLISWLGPGAGWRRYIAPFVLLVALVPAIYSLDRGLWLGIGIGIVYLAVRLSLGGRIWALQVLVGVTLAVAAIFAVTPAGSIISARLAHPHSNAVRGNLSQLTVTSTAQGSPVVGYGMTRSVQGTFGSIAGGATDRCPTCQNPPLGTQGTIWNVIFTQGFGGTVLFVSFFAFRFWRARSDWSPYAVAGSCMLVMLAVYVLVYDLQGAAMFTMFMTLGIMWRHEREREAARSEADPADPAVADDAGARGRLVVAGRSAVLA